MRLSDLRLLKIRLVLWDNWMDTMQTRAFKFFLLCSGQLSLSWPPLSSLLPRRGRGDRFTNPFFRPWALVRDSSLTHCVNRGTAYSQLNVKSKSPKWVLLVETRDFLGRSNLDKIYSTLRSSRGMKTNFACAWNRGARHKFLPGWPESGFWVINSVDSWSRGIFYIQWLYADLSSLPHSVFNSVQTLAVSSSLMTSGCWVKILFPSPPTVLQSKPWRVWWTNRFIQRLFQVASILMVPCHCPFLSLRRTHIHIFFLSLSLSCIVLPHKSWGPAECGKDRTDEFCV